MFFVKAFQLMGSSWRSHQGVMCVTLTALFLLLSQLYIYRAECCVADGQPGGKSWWIFWAAESRSTVDPWVQKVSEWKRQHLRTACKVVVLRNPAEYRFNRDPRQLESLRNNGIWKHQRKWMLRPFGKSYNEPVGNSAFLWSLAALLWLTALFDNMKAMLCIVCSCSDFSDVPCKLLAA